MTADTPVKLQLTSDDITKYKTAAEIANSINRKCRLTLISAQKLNHVCLMRVEALAEVAAHAVEGAKLIDLCKLGDAFILQETEKVFTKLRDGKKIPKGIALPTCVNINGYICHLSPTDTDPEASITLKKGDLVSIELGAHVDGYPASIGGSVVVAASKENPVTGKLAKALKAAHTALQAALKVMKPGSTNYDVTDVVQSVVKEYECIPVEGIMSTQILPVVGEGDKQIVLNPNAQQRKDIEKAVFEAGEVYTLDVLVSTGPGKAKMSSARTTIHKRIPSAKYNLKMQTSRKLLSEVQTKFGFMPFSLRSLPSAVQSGIPECTKNGLLLPFVVLEDSDPEAVVAQFTTTVLILAKGTQAITQPSFSDEHLQL